MKNYGRLRCFLADLTRLVSERSVEDEILDRGGAMLGDLVSHDDWLPEECGRQDERHYQQYLIHCDPLERFSVVSFVWGPGQSTPTHDHTVWGLVGMLRGRERSLPFLVSDSGVPAPLGAARVLEPGDVERNSPRRGEIHRVENSLAHEVPVSIHVYGGNIGAIRRHTFDAETGRARTFVSRYSRPELPNIWDRSRNPETSLA